MTWNVWSAPQLALVKTVNAGGGCAPSSSSSSVWFAGLFAGLLDPSTSEGNRNALVFLPPLDCEINCS